MAQLFCRLTLMAALCCLSLSAMAQKPKWVGNTPKALNNTYRFVEVTSYGETAKDAQIDAVTMLGQNEQLRRTVTVNVRTKQITTTDVTVGTANDMDEMHDASMVTVETEGKKYSLQASLVDSWIESEDSRGVRMHSLYQVAVANNAIFDNTSLTNTYGALPAVMSIIPGLGQVYKGSIVKGAAFFGGTALCLGAALFCENQRSDYRNKMKQQPKFAQTYNTKSSNWETGRNICLVAAGAVWVYNIVDAALAKGARRVIVEKPNGRSFSFRPTAIDGNAGVALTYNF